jgi:hypothetical protein
MSISFNELIAAAQVTDYREAMAADIEYKRQRLRQHPGLRPSPAERKRLIAMGVADLIAWNEWRHLVPQRRKPRKPDIRKMVAAAEKAGKSVTSVTMPDGTVLHFGESSDPTVDDASRAWDEAVTAKRRTLDAKPN